MHLNVHKIFSTHPKKNNSLIKNIFLILLFLSPFYLNCVESGYRYFKNYTYKEYDHQPQNWGMAQTSKGIIYAANNGGVLEFDGVSWNVIGIPEYSPVHSIAIDPSDTIYVGGIGEIGYLSPNGSGEMKYKSLNSEIPQKFRKFSTIWKIYIIKEDIYFQSSEFIFHWNSSSRKMNVMVSKQRFYFSFLCSGKLIIREEEQGLMEIKSNSIQPVPGGKLFKNIKIFMIAPYSNSNKDIPTSDSIDRQSLLIGTEEDGFYIFDHSQFHKFETEVDTYLKINKLYHGIQLLNGDYALATRRGGMVIMNSNGELKSKWDKAAGLLDNCVYYIFEDNERNVWLCLSKGLAKIENASPLSIYDDRRGLNGIVITTSRYKGDLYVGTINGLFYLDRNNHFTLINGLTGTCWSLLSMPDSLLAATAQGVFQVDKGEQNQLTVITDPSLSLCRSHTTPGRIWCGTKERLIVLKKKDGYWQEEYRFKPINQEIRTIAEEKSGTLWLTTNSSNIIKMEFPHQIDHPVITRYETSHGLPGNRFFAAPVADHIIFATDKGLFRFDEQKNSFIPDQTIGGEFIGGTSAKSVFRVAEDKVKNVWIQSESRNFQAIYSSNGNYTIYDMPFRRIPLIQVNSIYPELNGKIAWFASTDGLIKYDSRIKKNYKQQFLTLLRKVTVNEKIIVNNSKAGQSQNSRNLSEFNYSNRNIMFKFAAPFFESETETRYRCFLEGYDEDWSDWGKDTKRNYTNLDPKLYTFKVQAKNIYGETGSIDTFQFKILPPWYQKWWAFILYIALIFFVVFLSVKWRSSKLEKEKQRLEYTVIERTKEIQEKNRKLKEQSEKLKELDNVKSRFFANLSHEFRTPLTLIMGPLEQMMSEKPEPQQIKRYDIMLRNAQRLLGLINRLLELSRFDSGKVKLLASLQDIIPFIRGIITSFQLAARKNKLELYFHSEIESQMMYFDTSKMEEVMYNLLINALRFTPTGGEITVSISRLSTHDQIEGATSDRGLPAAGYITISVKDTGKGIAKEQLQFIFDRFYQARNSQSSIQEIMKGTGIGLSLVKENVELHHGNIDVHSQEGKGTEFVIRLPLGNAHLKPEEILVADSIPSAQGNKENDLESLIMLENNGLDSEVETFSEGDVENKSKSPHHLKRDKPLILVVEDNIEVRQYICNSLNPDYSVIEAGNGKEGIKKAYEFIPDLVVSDIMMPEVDGCQLCNRLKTDIKTSHIPIILLTAKASEDSIIEGLETGADDYITKPFNTKIVLTRIKNLIELRRQLQQKIQKQLLLQPTEIDVSSMDQEFIEEIQAVIEKNLSNSGFNVEQLSKKLYMNRVTLYRKMMALTGETPTDFIRSYRLKRAAQLLRERFGNVSQVAIEVGFSNLGYFSKCFKEKFHQSPLSYQESESSLR